MSSAARCRLPSLTFVRSSSALQRIVLVMQCRQLCIGAAVIVVRVAAGPFRVSILTYGAWPLKRKQSNCRLASRLHELSIPPRRAAMLDISSGWEASFGAPPMIRIKPRNAISQSLYRGGMSRMQNALIVSARLACCYRADRVMRPGWESLKKAGPQQAWW